MNWTIGTEALIVDDIAAGIVDDAAKKCKVLPVTAGCCASTTCWAGSVVRLRADWPTAATVGNWTSWSRPPPADCTRKTWPVAALFCGTTSDDAPAATITGLFAAPTSATAGRGAEDTVVNVLGNDNAETVETFGAWLSETVEASTFAGATAAANTVPVPEMEI